MNSAASASMSSCSTVRTDSRIRSTASPVRNTSSRSDTADWGKAIGLVSFGECLAVHTEDLADGSHIYEAAPTTLNPHHSAGRSPTSCHCAHQAKYQRGGRRLHRVH